MMTLIFPVYRKIRGFHRTRENIKTDAEQKKIAAQSSIIPGD